MAEYYEHGANTEEFERVVLKELKWSFVLAPYQTDPVTFFVEPWLFLEEKIIIRGQWLFLEEKKMINGQSVDIYSLYIIYIVYLFEEQREEKTKKLKK